ncbi:MAG: DNA-directed RNA polymerase II core subunit rpb9 [Chrysothrix sp. TS-e1954]|nr:MAG: DNA-directed RNA polymerase II core subunit rpb9 [Chrysothrix sp. TS-e1954]
MEAEDPDQKPTAEAPATTKISFKFCRECSNLLYPREHAETQKLIYACATCPYEEEAKTSCVYRNELGNTVGETAGITQDVGSDPTVGDFSLCTMCGQPIMCQFCGKAQADSFIALEVEDQVSDEVSMEEEEEDEEPFSTQQSSSS